MKKKSLAIIIAMMLILTLSVGCGKDSGKDKPAGGGDTPAGEGKADSEQYLNINLGSEPSTLDASKGSDNYSSTVLNNVFEPLTRLEEDDDKNNTLEPAGAESWDSNEDGTVWTFKIRDMKWSDGEKVTAADYEYGIKRSIDQETASPYAFLLMPIKNAEKVNAGEMGLDELGVKSLDESTLEITLETTTPYFLDLTYQRVMFPQRKDIIEANGERYGSEPETLVYNGPFTLTSWVHNSELVLTKNDSYWDNETVQLQNVNLKIIQDENAGYNSLSNGSLDVAVANKPEWKDKFLKDEKLNHFEVINPQTFFMFFNTQDTVFKNANIRKAFSAAIDREDLAEVIFHGVNAPAYGWVPPSISIDGKEYRDLGEDPVKTIMEENKDAKALLVKGLEELGMDTDPSKLVVTISLGSTDQWFRTYGEYLQQTFINTLGVDFKVEQMEWPVFNSNVEKGEFQIGYMAWGADFNDPSSMLSLFKSDAGAIATGWENARYDELIDLASKEMDASKRLEYFKEAEQILIYEESPVAPVVYPKQNVFRYKYVNGLGITPFGTAGYKYGYTQGR